MLMERSSLARHPGPADCLSGRVRGPAWSTLLRRALSLLALAPLFLGAAAPTVARAAGAAAPVVVLTLDGAVSPATADYIVRGLREAADRDAGLVVLRIDTPGGLDTSMRVIVKEILASPVPVAGFVAPGGARAASAGTFLLYASHVAAMAPATNLGAATPVQIGGAGRDAEAPARSGEEGARRSADDRGAGKGGDSAPSGEDAAGGAKTAPREPALERKQMQDAAAYIRSLAQLRGRNADWGERAVREAASLAAQDAKAMNVIDLIATDVPDLLRQLDGRKLVVGDAERTLHTAGAAQVTLDPDWRSQLLAVIADPNIALILIMIGAYGLLFEFMNPGMVMPGVVGGISLLLGLFALQMLPINFAGIALLALGLALVVAEAFVPSFGALGIGGAIAITLGAVMMLEPGAAATGLAIVWPVAAAVGIISAAVVFLIVTFAFRARRRPVVSGAEELVGASGIALEDIRDEGWARVHGESWRVRSAVPLPRGQRIRVVAVDGLTLAVAPATARREGEDT